MEQTTERAISEQIEQPQKRNIEKLNLMLDPNQKELRMKNLVMQRKNTMMNLGSLISKQHMQNCLKYCGIHSYLVLTFEILPLRIKMKCL